MPLTTQNIEVLLEKQVQAYLYGKITYEGLRSICLKDITLQSVISELSIQLEALASDEIALKTHEYTQQGHESQICDDIREEKSDTIKFKEYQKNRNILTENITNLDGELLSVGLAIVLNKAIFDDANDELNQANVGNVENSSLLLFHQNTEVELNERQKYYELQLAELEKQLSELESRKIERNKRIFKRIQCPGKLDRKALSDSNADLLDAVIESVFNSINATCTQMKRAVKKQCYDVFLMQLSLHIDMLLLNEIEKTSLKKIVEIMKKHQADIAIKIQQESKLAFLHASLQTQQQSLANKQAPFKSFVQKNERLSIDNERLNTTLLRLQLSREILLEQRNRFATFSLAAVGVAAISAITAYFLIQAGVIALVPGVNLVLGAAAGLAIMGFAVTGGIAAIRASYKHVDILTCEKNIRDNSAEMDHNASIINQSEQADISDLKIVIENMKDAIIIQIEETKRAGVKAAASMEQARKIKLAPYNNYARLYPASTLNTVACEDSTTLKLG